MLLQNNWTEWFVIHPNNEDGNRNMAVFSNIFEAGSLRDEKLWSLVKEIVTVILATDANNKIMILHSPKNFGGTRSRSDDKVICVLSWIYWIWDGKNRVQTTDMYVSGRHVVNMLSDMSPTWCFFMLKKGSKRQAFLCPTCCCWHVGMYWRRNQYQLGENPPSAKELGTRREGSRDWGMRHISKE